MVSYDATTEAVTVTVRPVYLDDRSDAVGGRFVFTYFIRIENNGADDVQLLRRRWRITDAAGTVQHVEGPGVVGEQPRIAPGAAHEYHSFCVLPTFTGTMEGNYLLQHASGDRFRATIPRFYLQALTN